MLLSYLVFFICFKVWYKLMNKIDEEFFFWGIYNEDFVENLNFKSIWYRNYVNFVWIILGNIKVIYIYVIYY